MRRGRILASDSCRFIEWSLSWEESSSVVPPSDDITAPYAVGLWLIVPKTVVARRRH